MILTNTNNIEGKQITEYLGLVYGETITGINFVKDFAAGIRDIIGGRSSSYEEELINARRSCIAELKNSAEKLNADAVVNVTFNIETIGANGSMLLINVVGTAVKIK